MLRCRHPKRRVIQPFGIAVQQRFIGTSFVFHDYVFIGLHEGSGRAAA